MNFFFRLKTRRIIILLYIKRILTTRLPMTTVARKNGIQDQSPTNIQSHMDSIHSPQSTRNTIINECMKSVKFHRGNSPSTNLSTLSEIGKKRIKKLIKF